MRVQTEWWKSIKYLILAGVTAGMLSACENPFKKDDDPAPVVPTVTDVCDDSGTKVSFDAVAPSLVAGAKKTAQAVPAGTLRIHYNRPDNDYTGWELYTFNPEVLGAWPGKAATGTDTYGAYWDVPVGTAASVNFIIHKGNDVREPSNWSGANADQQQFWAMSGGNEIWKKAGNATNYTSDPSNVVVDIKTVRVHYKRFDGDYAKWGLHLWEDDPATTDKAENALDKTGLVAGTVHNVWEAPVGLEQMPGYKTDSFGVTFDIPVVNPKDNKLVSYLEFIIHGNPAKGGNSGDKDGRNDNIRVNFDALKIADQVAEIWLVQEDPQVYTAGVPDVRAVSSTEARAYWMSKQFIKYPKVDSSGKLKLYFAKNGGMTAVKDGSVTGSDASWDLTAVTAADVPADLSTKFKYVSAGVLLKVPGDKTGEVAEKLKGQILVVQENADGKVQNATTPQIQGVLDDVYAAQVKDDVLGLSFPSAKKAAFKLWAPTAQKVTLCVYDNGSSGLSSDKVEMTFDKNKGVWTADGKTDWYGKYYKYAVDVFVKATGKVERNRVTDPMSFTLSANSFRTMIVDLNEADTKPDGWDTHAVPATVVEPEDMSIYELHVRDFSITDNSVSAANRGKYLAFTEAGSNGMKHLKGLADAGMTDIHLLPVYDIASVNEAGCINPTIPTAAADSEEQQAAIASVKDKDCFNWGYDPWHYGAPEGSYATDAANGISRVKEFRAMVKALHETGLRVGMDVVYNHTDQAGQGLKSVLDRIVPGYYQRLNATGGIETSTCCQNTAAEFALMEKLMIDTAKVWVKDYKIDSFRFDLMGHHPRSTMENLRDAVKMAAGKSIQIIGEGWNFGEVQNGSRFVQASQLSLNGSGIGTFSDRARDAVRGGGPFDGGDSLVTNQGFATGMYYDSNGSSCGTDKDGNPIACKTKDDLLVAGDWVKLGMAGSIRTYQMTNYKDKTVKLQEIDYGGAIGGYVSDPSEVVNYVENHDNQTFWDIAVYKLPKTTSSADRARMQAVAFALNGFSQGIPYFHAGMDVLRSKSMDRNSYNAGDHFNKLDWTYNSNNFGVGLPDKGDNGANYSIIKPLLTLATAKPTKADIEKSVGMFRDMLMVRKSSTLFRLRTADDIIDRVKFYNTGSTQTGGLVVKSIDGNCYAGGAFNTAVVLLNVTKDALSYTHADFANKDLTLHTAQLNGTDDVVKTSAFDKATGKFTVPARTAAVFVESEKACVPKTKDWKPYKANTLRVHVKGAAADGYGLWTWNGTTTGTQSAWPADRAVLDKTDGYGVWKDFTIAAGKTNIDFIVINSKGDKMCATDMKFDYPASIATEGAEIFVEGCTIQTALPNMIRIHNKAPLTSAYGVWSWNGTTLGAQAAWPADRAMLTAEDDFGAYEYFTAAAGKTKIDFLMIDAKGDKTCASDLGYTYTSSLATHGVNLYINGCNVDTKPN